MLMKHEDFEGMFRRVLEEGLSGLGWTLPEPALEAMARYARMVREWNDGSTSPPSWIRRPWPPAISSTR
jgi:hypothetical protein